MNQALHNRQTLQIVGLILFALGMLAGAAQLAYFFIGLPVVSGAGSDWCFTMCCGSAIALPAGLFYLTFPRLLDRYDPEPWYALLMCLAWGAIAACGFSVTVNTVLGDMGFQIWGRDGAEIVGAVISAPIFEEFFKALAVWGIAIFLRREFDGVVDGIIYACFVALGFAMIENIIYYARAAGDANGDTLKATVLIRGVLAPWGHPLYTAMTGIGVGISREVGKGPLKYAAPVLGYMAAVFLHMVWNGSAVAMGHVAETAEQSILMLACSLSIWLVFVAGFIGMVIFLVRRRGKIIRKFLMDEVAIGTISEAELDMTVSMFGLLRSRIKHGAAGAEFVRSVARLSLSKWHTARATKNSMHTVSMSFIGPLRQKITELRAKLPNGTLI